jgi:hypothetical protein
MTGLLGATGCDSQVDSDYPGESLATVRGTIANERTLPTPEAHAGLFWIATSAADQNEYLHGESVEVSGDFPAQFQLDLFQPPPEEALDDLAEENGEPLPSRVAVAMISVTDQSPEELGAIEDPGSETFYEHFLGIAEQYVVIYAEQPTEEFVTNFGEYIAPLDAGYNLVEVIRGTPDERQAAVECWRDHEGDPNVRDICPFSVQTVPAPGGASTTISIRLVDDYREINAPLQ